MRSQHPCMTCQEPIPWSSGDYPLRYAGKRFCSQACANRARGINPETTRYRHRRKGLPEHRAVMQESLGRLLLPTDIVHHRNGDKLDNRPENLVLTDARTHGLEHHSPTLPVEKACVICGAIFRPHKTKRRRAQTCSRVCLRARLSQCQR